MRPEPENFPGSFASGAARYHASALKEHRASGYFEAARKAAPKDSFARAIRDLSSEDEEMPLPDDQGPIVFKDGVFQIDVANAGAPAAIDPALKGLIDSILRS
jgi:hypothetical protein